MLTERRHVCSETRGPHRITFEVLFSRSPAHGNTCLGTLRRTIRMCSRQTEAPTILMQSWGRVFGHRFRRIVMFNEMLHICTFLVAPLSAKCGGATLKTQLKLAKWDMRHTLGHPTYREPKDVSRNRHIAPRCRACYDLQRNPTVVLRNFRTTSH